MSSTRLALVAVVILCPAMVVAQSAPPALAACTADRARFAVGEVYTPDLAERARQAAGARLVRKIEPGGAYTMDFSPSRLNVEVDQGGTVRGVECG
jgi:Peptidase inhibitor I78 family